MFKFLILFFIYIGSALADPSLTISANKSNMAVNETSTITFIFSQTVAGFDATDINAVGGTISAFSGSGATYTATFTKTDINESVIIVDNNSYTPNGTGNFLGLNVSKLYFMNSGALFSSAKVLAVPQPRCPLTGEQLVNPALPVKEQFFTLERTAYGNSLYYKEAKDTCLVRLQTGQSWQPKASPSAVELGNLHGVHNHTGLFPKVSTQQLASTDGTDKIRVRAYNHDAGLTLSSVATSVSSNSMLIGSHTYTTNVALGLGVNVAVQIANTANQAQYVRGRVVSNSGTTLVVNVTQSNTVATLANWTISTILRVSGHIALEGSSRFNFSSCSMGFFDPIVKPGQKGTSHHHTFYGNCSINENTTTATIHNSTSSAAGGIANQTGYWAPSMIDTATGVAMNPTGVQAYYKSAKLGLTEKLPQGLKIIAGNHLATGGQGTGIVSYNCYPNAAAPLGDNLASCPVGTTSLQEVVRFFPCVQDDGAGGIVLDSIDHKSHMAQFLGASSPYANGCPSGFPHLIPVITILVSYDVKKGQNISTWRLSSDNYALNLPGGYSAHADWMMGWRDEWAQRVVTQCNNSFIDCGEQFVGLNNGIGAGTTSGVTISSVTVTGNVATITTSVPHGLPIDLNASQGGMYYYGASSNVNNGYLLARITGVTGTDSAAYNFDPLDALANNQDGTVNDNVYRSITSTGVQSLKVIDATHLQYTLNYIPTNTTPTTTGMKIRWGESLCSLEDACSSGYYNLYYPVP